MEDTRERVKDGERSVLISSLPCSFDHLKDEGGTEKENKKRLMIFLFSSIVDETCEHLTYRKSMCAVYFLQAD